jgi:hypothetical protein
MDCIWLMFIVVILGGPAENNLVIGVLEPPGWIVAMSLFNRSRACVQSRLLQGHYQFLAGSLRQCFSLPSHFTSRSVKHRPNGLCTSVNHCLTILDLNRPATFSYTNVRKCLTDCVGPKSMLVQSLFLETEVILSGKCLVLAVPGHNVHLGTDGTHGVNRPIGNRPQDGILPHCAGIAYDG